MWFVRRMLKIPRVAKRTNKSILEEINRGLRLKVKIRSQQAKFFGHVMRRKELENHITSAKIEGTRARGRQREKMTDSMARWMESNTEVELIRKAEDRDEWRMMISSASRQGT